MCDEQKERAADGETISEQAEKIVSEGKDVSSRVRTLITDAIKNKNLGMSELGDVAKQVLDGSLRSLEIALAEKKKACEEQQSESEEIDDSDAKEKLSEIFAGIDEAFSDTARATGRALDEARERGERFAKDDLGKTITDLKALEEMLLSSLRETASKSQRAISEQLRAIENHSREVGSKLRPSVEAALTAAKNHPVEFSREAVGQIAYAMSALLQAAGDAISGAKGDKKS